MLYRSFLKLWLLPPMLNILLVAIGLAVIARYRRLGIAICIAGLGSLLALSVPLVSNGLLASIEVARPIDLPAQRWQKAGAIVVLGGGHVELAPEYGGRAWPTSDAQARLSYAAWLQRQIQKPLMLTGGTPSGSQYAHAQVCAEYLQSLFGLQPVWIEASSRTTAENAQQAAAILLQENIHTIVLVTQSMHMRRALLLFEQAGFDVIPAPTELADRKLPVWQASSWLPSADRLADSSLVLHEILGYWVHRLTGL
ncbi:MAG: YdcF family protein [Gammaproteobacteria bacterium]|nr:YdcF family protein [Gammaproteobacteria bacterium]